MAFPDSDYPGGIDSFPDPDTTLDGTPLHSELHLAYADAIEKMQIELSINPAGTFPSVAARLDTPGYALIQSLTPGTGSTSAAFATHPNTFSHLVVEGMVSHNNASGANTVRALALRFNGDSGANYHSLYTAILQTGSVFTADTSGGATTTGRFGSIGSLRGTFRLFIPHYSLTTGTRLCQSNGVASSTATPGSTWRTDSGMVRYNVAASITQVSLFIVGGAGDAFDSANRVSLYGLR